MIVHVDKIRVELDKYNNLITKYENAYLNLYHELNSASLYWNDGNSPKFFENVDSEKNKVSNSILELKSVRDVYFYIAESYEKLGNRISFDLKYQDSIINKFNLYIDKLDKIITLYNELDLTFCAEEANLLRTELDKLDHMKYSVTALKEKVRKIFMQIEEIEKEVHSRLSKIDIEIIKKKEINEFIG